MYSNFFVSFYIFIVNSSVDIFSLKKKYKSNSAFRMYYMQYVDILQF